MVDLLGILGGAETVEHSDVETDGENQRGP